MLLPVQSVGVMGDARTYDDVVAVRAVDTEDFMTADWSHLPYDLLARMSTRIINEVPGVNRVVYDISSQAAGHDRVGIGQAPVIARPGEVLECGDLSPLFRSIRHHKATRSFAWNTSPHRFWPPRSHKKAATSRRPRSSGNRPGPSYR